AVVPRMERLAPTEREPRMAPAPAKADAETKAPEESDKCRTIIGISPHRSRSPTPITAGVNPPTVVERRKTPRRVVYPRPAPRAYIAPVAVAVRRPVGRNIVGCPNVAVLRILLPSAVVVEVAVADHIAVHVARGNRVVLSKIALFGPLVQSVG